MRNVFKGFQVPHAVPKSHLFHINKTFIRQHTPVLHRPAIRQTTAKLPKMPRIPGKNPGVK